MANTLPLDGQLCFLINSASIAIQRVYKPMLDALGVTASSSDGVAPWTNARSTCT